MTIFQTLIVSLTLSTFLPLNSSMKKEHVGQAAHDAKRFHCKMSGKSAEWKDGKCQCKNCANDPLMCNSPQCNGAKIEWMRGVGSALSSPKCSKICPPGRYGQCCSKTKCLNGGVKLTPVKCDCKHTGYVGDFCQDRIKNCQNGGTKIEHENHCHCTDNYTGAECEELICYNGRQVFEGVCKCHDNNNDQVYSGQFCEKMKCYYGTVRLIHGDRRTVCECFSMFKGIICGTLNGAAYAIIALVVIVGTIAIFVGISAFKQKARERHVYSTPNQLTLGQTGDAQQNPHLGNSRSRSRSTDAVLQRRFNSANAVEQRFMIVSTENDHPPAYEDVIKYIS